MKQLAQGQRASEWWKELMAGGSAQGQPTARGPPGGVHLGRLPQTQHS